MHQKMAALIADELKNPDKYAPIARGPWVALCLLLLLGSMVPVWYLYQCCKKRVFSRA